MRDAEFGMREKVSFLNKPDHLPHPESRVPNGRRPPVISNGRIGMMLLVGTETILFTCFISAYMVLRMAAGVWPPIGTPKLTLGLSSINTAILLLSAIVLAIGCRIADVAVSDLTGPPLSRGRRQGLAVTACMALGALFALLQGVEFRHLYARGLTLQTGPYGAVVFSLIGCHGLHVLGGLAILAIVLFKRIPEADRQPEALREWIGYSEIYWHFVTLVWLILFSILYIL
jgi:cytochrome c oxidase subunit 3